MKMSDDQFLNEAGENGNNDDTGFVNDVNGVDFSNNETETTNGNHTEPAGENGSPEKAKIDKKNLEPEYFRKVFVGSLNYITTEETLKEHFAKFGELVDCVIMKESKSGKSRGFGFVTYLNSTMVDEMMKSRPHKLDGRELETKRATPREEAGKLGAEMSTKKLFVGAIKEGLTEEHLKEYFGKYGNIEDCIVMKDKETNKPRGFGFVSFDDYDPVDKIVLEKNHTVNNQSVAVKKALPKDQTNNGRSNDGNNRGNNRNGNDNRRNQNNGRGNNFNNRGNNFNDNYNDDFNSNNFNDNGNFNNFSNNPGFNGNPSNNGGGMPNFNFALIAQKMLQAANMGNGGPGNFGNGGGQFGNGGGMNNGPNGNMNGQRRGNGGPMRAGGNRQRNGPYQGGRKSK